MRSIVLTSSFAAAAMASPSAHVEMFEEFIQTYERKYEAEEKALRLEVFKANMKMIEESNAKNLSYTLGVTPYTDLAWEEFRARFVGGVTPMLPQETQNMTKFAKPDGFTQPDSIDWVEKGVVSSVKNQGKCGSCWSFSVAGALEGAMAIAGRKLVELSQQNLVDCDTGLLGGHGCSGGNPAQAMGWVKTNGICAAADYPYVCADPTSDSCKSAKCANKKCSPALKGGGWLGKGDVTAYHSVGHSIGELEAAVAVQPVSVSIEADQPVFQHYTGGVLTDDACGFRLDHAVLAVGYGVDKGLLSSTEYWNIKNSWGPEWGDKGYIRIARGKSANTGECGIRQMASFPTVAPASDNQVVV